MTRRTPNPGASSPAKPEQATEPTSTPTQRKAPGPAPVSNLRLRTADLGGRKSTFFTLEPDAAARSKLAEELGLLSLPRLRFEGKLEPKGRRDWELSAKLGATVVQPCVATLDPVKSRIDEKVERLFSADFIEPEGDEVEMPEDDRLEPLPEVIDLGEIMAESLSLALPLYPRAEKAPEIETLQVTPPGAEPMSDDDVKPFAGLKSLREQLFGTAPESDEAADSKSKPDKLH